ncbi:hypothetical protein BKA61DRAFT_80740 [Leptodontidium sp. MPI-SDFR-AT-0119]|nr:hypothetical protein BKA61DRAFT_80740 [Leptodontidium sp. MPI-SDFR-AT-0119]
MAPPKLAAKSIASTAADAAHAELSKYVESHTPGIVDKRPDTQPNFNKHLKTVDLQKTNKLVTDFLDNVGKKLAAEFLESKDAQLIRSYLLLYCARHTAKWYKGEGKVTIFVALGPLSCDNGLPKFEFENDPDRVMASGDALLVGHDTRQLWDRQKGGGFALVSEWTAPDETSPDD